MLKSVKSYTTVVVVGNGRYAQFHKLSLMQLYDCRQNCSFREAFRKNGYFYDSCTKGVGGGRNFNQISFDEVIMTLGGVGFQM